MNLFDQAVIYFFNEFAQQSCVFDEFVLLLSKNNLFKGAIIVVIFWWIWFERDEKMSSGRNRKTVLATFLGIFGVLVLSRFLGLVLPFRLRPKHDPDLAFQLPCGSSPEGLEDWSAFPSDNAALFFGMATGLSFISRRLGFLGFVYALVIISIPRIYLGLHYPTDITGGALLGIIVIVITNMQGIKKSIIKPVLNWSQKNPPLFYTMFFLYSFLLSTIFDSAREIVSFVFEILNIEPDRKI